MTVPTQVPRHAAGVRLRQAPDGALLVAAGPASTVAVDATALALWELCDGETTVAEMATAAAALFDAAPATLEHDITTVLTAMVDAGLLEWVSVPRQGAGRRCDAPDPGVGTTKPARGAER